MTDDQNVNINDSEPKLYEVGYLLSPLVPAGSESEAVATEITKLVTGLGGKIEAEISPNLIKLAYPVTKTLNHKHASYKEAYFGASRFIIMPSQLAAVKEGLDKSSLIIRFLLTVATPNMPFEGPKEEAVMESPENSVAAPVGEVPAEVQAKVMDQEIDNLLTEVA